MLNLSDTAASQPYSLWSLFKDSLLHRDILWLAKQAEGHVAVPMRKPNFNNRDLKYDYWTLQSFLDDLLLLFLNVSGS